MSLLIQPLTRLVSRGAVLLILLGTVLIPFDDLADPLRPRGHHICQSLSEKQELGRLYIFFMLIYHSFIPSS